MIRVDARSLAGASDCRAQAGGPGTEIRLVSDTARLTHDDDNDIYYVTIMMIHVTDGDVPRAEGLSVCQCVSEASETLYIGQPMERLSSAASGRPQKS